jgi:hypothetical protein
MDAGAQLHGGREAERPTMWLMSDFEALAFIATVALMVMLALDDRFHETCIMEPMG